MSIYLKSCSLSNLKSQGVILQLNIVSIFLPLVPVAGVVYAYGESIFW